MGKMTETAPVVERTSNVSKGMFTSVSDEWGTPWEFFRGLNDEFGFTLDVCASAVNAKCSAYLTKADNGLDRAWEGTCWMNPPYGRLISDWVEKAHRESVLGTTVVCLIPARTCTAYWHDHAMRASEIRFVRGRLRFNCETGPGSHNAPFPSAVVIFRPGGLSGCPAVPLVSTIDRNGKVEKR